MSINLATLASEATTWGGAAAAFIGAVAHKLWSKFLGAEAKIKADAEKAIADAKAEAAKLVADAKAEIKKL